MLLVRAVLEHFPPCLHSALIRPILSAGDKQQALAQYFCQ
jgi:hypothetical protein